MYILLYIFKQRKICFCNDQQNDMRNEIVDNTQSNTHT